MFLKSLKRIIYNKIRVVKQKLYEIALEIFHFDLLFWFTMNPRAQYSVYSTFILQNSFIKGNNTVMGANKSFPIKSMLFLPLENMILWLL